MSTEIPKTARAAVIEELGKPISIIQDYPVKQASELAPGECLVKLEYSGVCHSDLHLRNGDWPMIKPIMPRVGGHEGVGRIVAIGEHSEAQGIKIGDRVGLKWIADVCGRCEMCRTGFDQSCPSAPLRSHGFSVHGTFSQYAVSYLNYVTPIPESLDSAAIAPLFCAGLTVYSGVKRAGLISGQWMAISGAGGGLGHLGVQFAVAMGYRVLAIDTGEAKKEMCLKLGAEKWVDFRESKDIVADIVAATDGQGPHAAVVAATGDARPFNQAVMYVRRGGTLVSVGVPGGDAVMNIPVPLLVMKRLSIVGSALGNRQDMVEVLDLAARGKVKCEFELRDLNDLNEVFDQMENGKLVGRVVLKV